MTMIKFSPWIQIVILLLGVSGCSRSVEIIGHRGASHLAPENTMSAVLLGWEKGADVEVDVQLSKDNRMVVIHDKTTKHITGKDLAVAKTTSAELRKLDYGRFKSGRFAGEPIPFLEDVISSIPKGRKLYVEIKCGPEILPFLRKTIDESGKKSRIVIIGFDLETVARSKALMPGIPTYWLKGTEKDKETKAYIPHSPDLVRIARENGLDGLDVNHNGVDKVFMDAVEAAGQKLYVWTVDDPEESRRLVKLGVAGITTNRPGWLREQLER